MTHRMASIVPQDTKSGAPCWALGPVGWRLPCPDWVETHSSSFSSFRFPPSTFHPELWGPRPIHTLKKTPYQLPRLL